MRPYRFYTQKKIFNYYTGLSFFIFVWISRLEKDEVRLMRHETIHFWQQIELLFIFHWLLYGLFYVVARAKGHCHWIAYRYNPFELEAFDNDPDTDYLKKRRAFAWLPYVRQYSTILNQDLRQQVPADKFLKWRKR